MQQNKYSYFTQLEHVGVKDTPLSKLLQRANGILIHQETIRNLLEKSCRNHCWLANYRNGTLYLQSDSSAWGTRIRMQQRTLVQQLKSIPVFKNIKGVKVSIEPRAKVQKRQHTTKTISTENADQLEQTAKTTDDPKLRAALEHLAETARHDKRKG